MPKKENPAKAGWVLKKIKTLFKKYWSLISTGDIHEAFHYCSKDEIADRLITIYAKNGSILGIIIGILMSADEIITFVTGAEGGIGLPFNITVAVIVLSIEIIQLLKYQLVLIACLGKLYEVPLDPENPQDILTILAFTIGGSAANAMGTMGVKMGEKVASSFAESFVLRESITALTNAAEKLGFQMLQRAFLKYTVPLISILIGMLVNYYTIKSVGKVAKNYFSSNPAAKNGLQNKEEIIQENRG